MILLSKEERDKLAVEALEILKSKPEANPDLPSTETAAWRAGFVAGYVHARETNLNKKE